MSRARKLVSRLAADEELLRGRQFLAPCVRGGRVRVRLSGLVHTLVPTPADFEGWGVFVSRDLERAELVEEAGLPEVSRYLGLLKPLRLRMATKLERAAWLAWPANESDARQRGFIDVPVVGPQAQQINERDSRRRVAPHLGHPQPIDPRDIDHLGHPVAT